ncbi:hypothetical protein [Tumebacillus permanentifrigoris]|uniref:Uncharacterized protein n=1 Tax=Tumebacillus permanentifrigoris TaxID=378543 RepID=A0A316D3K7_9BACL|nr:hypothetical protein [Tumebacillus permanentifrigoris]PWK05324.1 hypothetical protein C7459_12476 [Tumebacillus permanentifrigoris]
MKGKCEHCAHWSKRKGCKKSEKVQAQAGYNSDWGWYEECPLWKGMTLKAYLVTEDDGDNSEIVFAHTNGQAKLIGLGRDWSYGEFTEMRALRRPEYDRYAEQGWVPKEELLKDGWWFDCHCGYARRDFNAIVIREDVYCEKCQHKAQVGA